MRLAACALVVAACAAPARAPVGPAPVPHAAVPPAAVPMRAATTAPGWIGVWPDHGTARVRQVVRGGPADRAGLRAGDVVVAIAGAPVQDARGLIAGTRALAPGRHAAIVVERAGQRVTLDTVPIERPQLATLQGALVGQHAPDFSLAAPGGDPVRLAARAGHVVLLEFWATWCGPCRFTAPRLDAWQRAYPDLAVIGISDEAPADVRRFVADHGLGYTIALDPDDRANRDYFVQALPTIVVIDRAGIVRFADAGVPDFDQLEALLRELMK